MQSPDAAVDDTPVGSGPSRRALTRLKDAGIAKTAAGVLARGLGAVGQLLLAVAVTHSLSKAEAGGVLLYLTVFAVVSAVMTFGSGYYTMRRLSEFDADDRDAAGPVAASLLRLQVIVSACGSLIVGGIVMATLSSFGDRLGLTDRSDARFFGGCLWAAATFMTLSLAVAYQCHGRRMLTASVAFSHILVPLLTAATIGVFGVGGVREVVMIHLGFAFAVAAAAVTFWRLRIADGNGPAPRGLDRKSALRSCGSFWLMNVSQLLMNWSPLLIAGVLLPLSDQAELNTAQRTANAINFLLVITSFVVMPKLRFAYARDDMIGFRRTVVSASRILIAIGIVTTVGIVLFAGRLMSFFGDQYATAGGLLIVFALGQCFNVVTGTVNQVLTMADRESTLKNICLLSAATAIVAGFGLTLRFGAVGAAAAAATALAIQNVIAVVIVRRQFGFWVFDVRGVSDTA